MATAKQVMNSIKHTPNIVPEGYKTAKGQVGYDNVRDVLPQNIVATSVKVGDNVAGTVPQVVPVIFGTAAVGTLTASNYPLGTIYLQYTA